MSNLSDPLVIDRFELERRIKDFSAGWADNSLPTSVLDEVLDIINQMCLEQVAGINVQAEQGDI